MQKKEKTQLLGSTRQTGVPVAEGERERERQRHCERERERGEREGERLADMWTLSL